MGSYQFLAVIVSVCLALQASADLDVTRWKNPSPDFKGLNKYLIDNVSDTAGPGANLDHVRRNIDNMEGGGIKRAAELILATSESARDCTADSVSILVALADNKLDPFGQTPVEKALREAGLLKTLSKCLVKLNRIPAEVSRDLDLRAFLYAFTAPTTFIGDELTIRPTGNNWIIKRVIESAEQDPKARFLHNQHNKITGKPRIVKDPREFEYALDSYLLKPCQRLLSDARLSMLLEGAPALRDLGTTKSWSQELLDNTKMMAWRVEACNKYLGMDAVTKEKLLQNFLP